ncbi:hypothetical protein AAHE18_06G261100 [Arachis hypogaea]
MEEGEGGASIVESTNLSQWFVVLTSYILPFAVKKTQISEDLLTRAHELWGLLPSFCPHANDTHQNFASHVLVSFLKKQPSMHENVFMALQAHLSCIQLVT